MSGLWWMPWNAPRVGGRCSRMERAGTSTLGTQLIDPPWACRFPTGPSSGPRRWAAGWPRRRRGTAMEEPVEVQALAIGDVALVALPGEFFAESGLRLRGRSPFRHTIPIGYADGGVGYVPPASAFAEGGYETRLAPWSRVAPEAEALVIGAAVDLLRELRDG